MKDSAATAVALGSIEAIRSALVLEAGTDPARIEALRVQMSEAAMKMKRAGYWALTLGILLSLTVLGAVIGLPMALTGAVMVWVFGRRVRNVNEACRQYLASIQAG